MIQQILELYQGKFGFNRFYKNLLYNIDTWKEYHIQNTIFMSGLTIMKSKEFAGRIIANQGDVRVDLPAWFGNPESSIKIVIIGLEPRDTASHLNIEKVEFNGENYVFAMPFAIERPGGKYHKAFQDLICRNDIFVYFTDVVKEYKVISKRVCQVITDIDKRISREDKMINDKNARKNFPLKANECKEFLEKELNIIQPTVIIGLGNDSYNKLKEFTGDKYSIERATHPAAPYGNGAEKAKRDIERILSDLKI